MVSGPTSCGKTFFVTQILQSNKIQPAPQRIILLYNRWQPLYDDLKRTVYPRVEFIQGIPHNLEDDAYLNRNVTNLIILDDLMSTSNKDPRITDLFTEWSHNRNLSVMTLN